VAVLNHNRVMGYMVPADVFECMMERLDDLELAEIVRSRRHYRLVYEVIDERVVVSVVALGKRERRTVYDRAKKR
jgi:PHD/YefM family antitoxin component YafN of YafNO toxin-antitoxin module